MECREIWVLEQKIEQTFERYRMSGGSLDKC